MLYIAVKVVFPCALYYLSGKVGGEGSVLGEVFVVTRIVNMAMKVHAGGIPASYTGRLGYFTLCNTYCIHKFDVPAASNGAFGGICRPHSRLIRLSNTRIETCRAVFVHNVRFTYAFNSYGLESAIANKVFYLLLGELIEEGIPLFGLVVDKDLSEIFIESEHEFVVTLTVEFCERCLAENGFEFLALFKFFALFKGDILAGIDHYDIHFGINAVLYVGGVRIIVILAGIIFYIFCRRRCCLGHVCKRVGARKIFDAAGYVVGAVDVLTGIGVVAREAVFNGVTRIGVFVPDYVLCGIQSELVGTRRHDGGVVCVSHYAEHIFALFGHPPALFALVPRSEVVGVEGEGNILMTVGFNFGRLCKGDEVHRSLFDAAGGIFGGGIQLNYVLAGNVAVVGDAHGYGVFGGLAHIRAVIERAVDYFPAEIGIGEAVTEGELHHFVVGRALCGEITGVIGSFVPLIAEVYTLLIYHAVLIIIFIVYICRIMGLIIVSKRIGKPARGVDVAL